MNAITTKVRVPKTAELVANHLRDQIISGKIAEGDHLPNEAEMVEQYKISRPTLREAFRILESEGLISISRGSRGARVHLPEINVVSRRLGAILRVRGVKLDDVYRARALVEPPAARLIAERRDRTDVTRLREVIESERSSLDDWGRFSLASNEFHRALVQLAGVQTLGLIVDILNEMLERHLLSLYMSSIGSGDHIVARRKSLKAQQKLVDLLEAGDAPEAEAFWRQHLTVVGQAIAKLERIDQDIHIDRL